MKAAQSPHILLPDFLEPALSRAQGVPSNWNSPPGAPPEIYITIRGVNHLVLCQPLCGRKFLKLDLPPSNCSKFVSGSLSNCAVIDQQTLSQGWVMVWVRPKKRSGASDRGAQVYWGNLQIRRSEAVNWTKSLLLGSACLKL